MKLSAGNDFRRKANQVFKWLRIATGFINLVVERSQPAAKSLGKEGPAEIAYCTLAHPLNRHN
jgi:hypothetical protein